MAPLSEHEQKMLAQIEQQLAESDPTFSRRLKRVERKESRKLLKLGTVGLVLGLGLLISFTVHVALGVAGFLVMLVSLAALLRGISAVLTNRATIKMVAPEINNQHPRRKES